MQEPEFDLGDPLTERIEILINPETGAYHIDAGMVRISHMYMVLKDLIERLENNEFSDGSNPDLHVYPVDKEGDILD